MQLLGGCYPCRKCICGDPHLHFYLEYCRLRKSTSLPKNNDVLKIDSAPIPGGGHQTLLYQRGGAIYIHDGTIVIRDSTFDANSADLVSG
jgi:hypothetical protein